jgi:hypothetical protein
MSPHYIPDVWQKGGMLPKLASVERKPVTEPAGAHIEPFVRETLTRALAESTKRRTAGQQPQLGKDELMETHARALLLALDNGCSPWWAAHIGLMLGEWMKEADLWRMAVRGHKVERAAARGGESRRGQLKAKPEEVRRLWNQLRKSEPKVGMGVLDRRVGARFGLSPRTVGTYRRNGVATTELF